MGASDPDAANQGPSECVRDSTSTMASALSLLPPSTSEQLRESVQRQLSGASHQETSSPSALGVPDSALPLLPPSTLDQTMHAQRSTSVHSQLSVVNGQAAWSPSAHHATGSVTNKVADSITKCARLGSSASDVAWQHHSCNRSGNGGLAVQEPDFQRAGLGKLASKDGLVGRSSAASVRSVASSASSESSSRTCSNHSSTTSCSKASHSCSSSSSSSEGSSCTACSEGQASPAPSGGTVSLSRSAEGCRAALLWTNEAEDNKQLPASVLPAGSKQEVAALALSNESVIADSSAPDGIQTSILSSSASADVQTSPAVAQDSSDSIAGSSEALQTAGSRAEHAESSLIASTSGTEAHPGQACLAANALAGAGHRNLGGNGQHEVLQGASEALMLAEMHACPPSQVITSTGIEQAGESAQLGIVLTGHGVCMIGRLPEARAEAAAVCDVQTELADTGMQTDFSMLACKLPAETKSCCGAPIGGAEVKADTQVTEPEESLSVLGSGQVSGSSANQEAARQHSLPDGPVAESACGVCPLEDGLSSSDADAEGPVMHNSKTGGIAIIPGVQLCMSNVDANQSDDMCAQAGMQRIGKTDRVQHGSAHVESNMSACQQNMAVQQARLAMLGLVTACGGHDSLKELIRADMSCFLYEKDCLLMSIVERIRDTLTADSI